jgi:hypothetical protein
MRVPISNIVETNTVSFGDFLFLGALIRMIPCAVASIATPWPSGLLYTNKLSIEPGK